MVDEVGRRVARRFGIGLTLCPRLGLALTLALTPALACTPCERAGCDAMGAPAAEHARSSIAGAVASESDVVANSCQECGFATATLAIWRTAGPVADAASAKTIVDSSAPSITVQADRRYAQDLDPGSYLVCERPSCVSVDVVADHVTTVHVRKVFGPTRFIVFDAQARTARNAPTLEVGL